MRVLLFAFKQILLVFLKLSIVYMGSISKRHHDGLESSISNSKPLSQLRFPILMCNFPCITQSLLLLCIYQSHFRFLAEIIEIYLKQFKSSLRKYSVLFSFYTFFSLFIYFIKIQLNYVLQPFLKSYYFLQFMTLFQLIMSWRSFYELQVLF